MKKELRNWMFKAILFESEADSFRKAGIRLGADIQDAELSLIEEILNPFPILLRNEALRMTRLYALIYCFENSVREVIQERLEEMHGIDWWEKGVPKKVRDYANKVMRDAKDNSWLEGEKTDPISFIEFGHLADIITNSWDNFSDLIPTQHWLKQRFSELEKARNFIAHNRLLLPSEFKRLEMYAADWIKQVGI